MRLSKQATTPVPRRDFWIAVAAAAVLVCGIGLYTTEIQKLPIVKSWFWISPWLRGGTHAWVWGITALEAFRFGQRVFSRQWLVFLVGYTLFVGSPFLPHAPAVVSWLSNIGLLMVLAGTLAPLVEVGRRQATASAGLSDDPANQPR